MDCPVCKYAVSWDTRPADAPHGKFYEMPIRVTRADFYDRDEQTVYGCPCCGVMFMDCDRRPKEGG